MRQQTLHTQIEVVENRGTSDIFFTCDVVSRNHAVRWAHLSLVD